jgi:hypothetical protein
VVKRKPKAAATQKIVALSITEIEHRILLVRSQKVMIDADLAELYGVPTKALNQAVRRNLDRFPEDFMFRLTQEEKQQVVTNCDHLTRLRYSPTLPAVFTEHGALMVASVLNTPRAVEISVYIVRAFVKLREIIASNKVFAAKLRDHERKLQTHDQVITGILKAIQQLTTPPIIKKRGIGFVIDDD